MTKRIARRAIRIAVFFAIFAVFFAAISPWFSYPDAAAGKHARTRMEAFYREPKNTVDVVLIGASSFYYGWLPLEAYQNYGYTSLLWSSAGQPSTAPPFLVEEVMKHQDPQLILIDYRTFARQSPINETNIRGVTDNMPESLTRIKAIYSMTSTSDISSEYAFLDYYIKFLAYHNAWETDSFSRLRPKPSKYKGSIIPTKSLLTRVTPQEMRSGPHADLGKLAEENEIGLERTIQYIKKHDIPVLFIALPFNPNYERRAELNTVEARLDAEGMPYLNMVDSLNGTDIDPSTDFRDPNHLNYLGAKRLTDALSRYLTENHSLPDHREDESYASWDTAYEAYMRRVNRVSKKAGLELAE